MTQLVAEILGMPDWLPRALTRTAALLLIAIYLVSPATFQQGVALFVQRETDRIVQLMEPTLHIAQVPAPTSFSGHGVAGGHGLRNASQPTTTEPTGEGQ